MAITREFLRLPCWNAAQKDAEFRKAMLKEGIDALLAGDLETGKAILQRLYQHGGSVLGLWPRLPTYRPKSTHADVGPEGKPAGGQPVSDHSHICKHTKESIWKWLRANWPLLFVSGLTPSCAA